ncbi:MAG: SIS domain-containing protein [Desulfobacterales bacterium]|nr:SIS domain-containing protein [Desulfobacterales bacterium]
MADALVIAISQSGTTTDTNRSVDMVRQRGAHTLAIVNRRDSDLTFKVDGVMYTSSGRDIEMSVASTKAFYAQIIAGALLGPAHRPASRAAATPTSSRPRSSGCSRMPGPHAPGAGAWPSASAPRPSGWPSPRPTGPRSAAAPTRPRPTRSASS